MPELQRLVLKLQAHATCRSYVWRERRLAAPTARERALSIVFTRRDAWEPALREGFRGLPHRLHFDDLAVAPLERYDLIVPLSLNDAQFLRQQAAQVRDRVVPLPDASCTDLCHDKPRLNRVLIDAGFALNIPPMGQDIAPPFVCKPAHGEDSNDCVLVPDRQTQQRLGDALERPGLFRQAAVPGKVELATHFLMRDGRLVRDLTVRYHHDQALYIKNAECRPAVRTLGRCPDAATLEAMLKAIGYDGLGCANYKFEQGRLQLIEINPRMGGSLCDYFFSFLRSMPSTWRTRRAGLTNWTWLDSMTDRESAFGA
jgi:hypothetical protein